MINMVVGLLAFVFLFLLCTVAIKVVGAIHGPVKLRKPLVDYNKIHDMELEIYGHTWSGMLADPSPRQQRAIQDTRKKRELQEQSERLLAQQSQWNPGPDWADEDGRPW